MNLKHVIKHVGNFCAEVAKGLIGYGREIEKGRSHINASYSLPASDGYATRESTFWNVYHTSANYQN